MEKLMFMLVGLSVTILAISLDIAFPTLVQDDVLRWVTLPIPLLALNIAAIWAWFL